MHLTAYQSKQDIIYIDAPWGGTDYKKNKHIELYMSGKNMGWLGWLD